MSLTNPMKDGFRIGHYLAIAFGLVALLLVVSLFGAGREAMVESECAKLGWPSAKLTANFDAYCLRRANQTDIIVSLDSARKLGRR